MPELTLKIKDVKSDSEKYEYAMNAKELLRILHNQKGLDYKEGRLSVNNWEAWKSEFFDPRSTAIERVLCETRETLKRSNKYLINLETDFE